MRVMALSTSLLFIVPVKNSGLPPPLAADTTSRNNFSQSIVRDEDLAKTTFAISCSQVSDLFAIITTVFLHLIFCAA